MKEQLKKRIADFWDGGLDTEQQKSLLYDLENHERDLRAQLKNDFHNNENVGGALPADAAQSVLEEVHRKMGVVKELPDKRRIKKYWMIAVALLSVIGLGVSIMLWQKSPSVAHNFDGNFLGETDTVRLINRNAEVKKTLLPDGSIVILSPGSELVFLKNAVKKDRVFHLKGEAQFQVMSDPLHPFVVWANGFTTTALGTEFTINAQAVDKVDVALLSGKVIVKSTERSVMQMADQYLLPGDKLSIDLDVQSISLRAASVNISESTSNAKKITTQKQALPFVFIETPLTDVFADIASKRQVHIVVDGLHLEGLSFTGEFSNTEPTLTIVHIVCQLNNLDYVERGHEIIIKQKEHIQTLSPIEGNSETTN